jgi:hypothetical protein
MLTLCIKKPPIVGPAERTLILERLLSPTAVDLSEGSTILVMKDCLMGIVNKNDILKSTRQIADNSYEGNNGIIIAVAEVMILLSTKPPISPTRLVNRETMR